MVMNPCEFLGKFHAGWSTSLSAAEIEIQLQNETLVKHSSHLITKVLRVRTATVPSPPMNETYAQVKLDHIPYRSGENKLMFKTAT